MLRTARFAWFRRFALVVASAQGMLYAVLPFAEARLDKPPELAGLESRHSHDCVPLHQPDKCVFCQLATMRARRTETATAHSAGRIIYSCVAVGPSSELRPVEPQPTRSRAPPATPA